MRSDQKVTDWSGKPLELGTRVIFGSPDPDKKDESTGTIIEITDYDVDYCDATERAECSPPRVKVRFDDGEEDVATTYDATPVSWNDYPNGPAELIFQADDLEVA